MRTVYEPRPRFIVEIADYVSRQSGVHEPTHWAFEEAFETLEEAKGSADYHARMNRFVRVIEKGSTDED